MVWLGPVRHKDESSVSGVKVRDGIYIFDGPVDFERIEAIYEQLERGEIPEDARFRQWSARPDTKRLSRPMWWLLWTAWFAGVWVVSVAAYHGGWTGAIAVASALAVFPAFSAWMELMGRLKPRGGA